MATVIFGDAERQHAARRWERLLRWATARQAPHWIFRGQSRDWPLRPSAGRRKNYTIDVERLMLDEFKRHAVSHFDTDPIRDNWNWLALAQHHGLPTRLLDWTYNPLVAAFFAAQPAADEKNAGVVYAIKADHFAPVDPTDEPDPFVVNETRFLTTPTHAPRLKAQKGLFSLHPRPREEFAPGRVFEFRIAARHKPYFQEFMYTMGIDAGSLMADLDGLCETLAWRGINNLIKQGVE